MRFLERYYPLALSTLAALLSVSVYPRLPDSMAVHWGIDGTPNGWMPRPFGAFFAPVFMLVLGQFLRLVSRIDPRADGNPRASRAYETIVVSVLLLLFACHGIVLAVALGYSVPVARLVPALVGALFIAIGSVMPRLQPNRWYGVRTPWTLSDDQVWVRTHRLAGASMTGAGISMIVAAFALPVSLGLPVVIGAAVAAVVGPAFYSYLTWRRTHRH
jgi:uncharacterized membrane protein